MKKATTKTDYILVRASANTDYDLCDFIIVKADEKWLTGMQEKLDRSLLFQAVPEFFRHTYWDCPVGFFRTPETEENQFDEILGDYDDWCYIDVAQTELDNLLPTLSELDGHQLHIEPSGLIQYAAHGTNHPIEFASSYINLFELLK
jgi:hypothetical protein